MNKNKIETDNNYIIDPLDYNFQKDNPFIGYFYHHHKQNDSLQNYQKQPWWILPQQNPYVNYRRHAPPTKDFRYDPRFYILKHAIGDNGEITSKLLENLSSNNNIQEEEEQKDKDSHTPKKIQEAKIEPELTQTEEDYVLL